VNDILNHRRNQLVEACLDVQIIAVEMKAACDRAERAGRGLCALLDGQPTRPQKESRPVSTKAA
jgi:hypothetical protein